MTRTTTGGKFATWFVIQILATGLAWLIPQIRQVAAERRQATAEVREFEARVQTVVAMNDALDPIIRLLGNLALEPRKVERDKFRAQAVPLVLTSAAQLIGPDRARACWFRLEPGPPTQLIPTDAVGRAGSPSTTFVEGTPSGDAAIGMVLNDEDRICEDILTEPPPGWDASKDRDYRTFVSVSVIAGDTAHGMLTLDALEPGELTKDDMRLLRLMAGALAIALSVP
ncbi:MAG TPA: GAF domain-containing protein [Nocardioidaceae bacterium]|nr:GAF domain-containing protein [Nocardioidaceae bacterium]